MGFWPRSGFNDRPLCPAALALDPGRFRRPLRYPDLPNPEEGYVRVMVDVLPSPLKGLWWQPSPPRT